MSVGIWVFGRSTAGYTQKLKSRPVFGLFYTLPWITEFGIYFFLPIYFGFRFFYHCRALFLEFLESCNTVSVVQKHAWSFCAFFLFCNTIPDTQSRAAVASPPGTGILVCEWPSATTTATSTQQTLYYYAFVTYNLYLYRHKIVTTAIPTKWRFRRTI